MKSGKDRQRAELGAKEGRGAGQSGGRGSGGKGVSTVMMLMSTALMLTLCFPPFYCFFLAPIALIPLSLCILRRPMNWRYAGLYYLLGFVFFLGNLFWLAPVTVFGYVILCAYLAIYVPVYAFIFHRAAVGCRLPAVICLPIAWTAVEYFRGSFVEGGFPWFMLGNSLAPAPLLIQTADLFGVWGLTFLIAMLNGALVDLLRLPLKRGGKFNPTIGWIGASATAAVAFVIVYGVWRLNQRTITAGPRVAVIQENIPQSVKEDPAQAVPNLIKHEKLTLEAAKANPRPDLIAWPETMVPGFLNRELIESPIETLPLTPANRDRFLGFREDGKFLLDRMTALSAECHVPLLLGATSFDPRTTLDDSIKQNRTYLVVGDVGVVESYSKVHLVPFGEYVPFRNWPLVGKYMVGLAAMGYDYSNVPGDRWTRFVLRVPPIYSGSQIAERQYTFATPICFEDTMPEPARKMTAPQFGGGRKTDFLVNVSNDGWFYSVELDQRLQASQMRAVENRVPIARSVNTGDSGFVDSCGRVVKLVTNSSGNSLGAVGTAAIEMPLDSRVTVFSQIGDLLPILCGVSGVLMVAWTFVRPRRG